MLLSVQLIEEIFVHTIDNVQLLLASAKSRR